MPAERMNTQGGYIFINFIIFPSILIMDFFIRGPFVLSKYKRYPWTLHCFFLKICFLSSFLGFETMLYLGGNKFEKLS